ncbi:MAG: 2-amino-4-hydroxy-6-hydroxymethyldihydropteridine diphosphokinase [Fretibacterium sp.]|nr:2-amino-4-hydroxy-6-hydroxymethyldihydropteridine diphosphokinase [Fretibacterium sp.]
MALITDRTAALGLGSNLGNRLENLREAAERLKPLGHITAKSDVFETEPWGVKDQPCFLNACLTIETSLAHKELLTFVKGIERDMGRRMTIRWGARNIDIDILLVGANCFDTEELHVPHLNLPNREFVLVPLMQILPGWRHPTVGLSAEEMLKSLRARESGGCPPLRITAL